MALIFQPNTLRELFGSRYSQIQTLNIDISVTENLSLRQNVTDKPVQDGARISDNIILLPDQVSIEGLFIDDAYAAASELLGGVPVIGTTWEEKLFMLQTIRKAREPFTIVTSFGAFNNMYFDGDIVAMKHANNANALHFTASLTGIGIIKSRTTAVPANDTKNPKKHAPATDKGKIQKSEKANVTSKTTAATVTQEKSKSWLFQSMEWINKKTGN